MKKILTIIMILLVAFSLIACSSPDSIEDDIIPEELPQPPEDEGEIHDPDENQGANEEPGQEDPIEEGPTQKDPVVQDRNDHYEDDGHQVVSLYFVNNKYMETGDESLEHMVVEEREIDYTTSSLEEAIIRELIKGPESANASTTIPQSVNLLGVEVTDGTAFVDFAREGMHGGSSQEGFTIHQIVSSLGQFNHIDRVQFLIDGEIVDSLMGHYTIDEPFEVEK